MPLPVAWQDLVSPSLSCSSHNVPTRPRRFEWAAAQIHLTAPRSPSVSSSTHRLDLFSFLGYGRDRAHHCCHTGRWLLASVLPMKRRVTPILRMERTSTPLRSSQRGRRQADAKAPPHKHTLSPSRDTCPPARQIHTHSRSRTLPRSRHGASIGCVKPELQAACRSACAILVRHNDDDAVPVDQSRIHDQHLSATDASP